MLGTVLDVFRLRQYFDLITGVREVGGRLREDVTFLNTVRRALVTFPFEESEVTTRPFPDLEPLRLSQLRGRSLGFVATGGSGALASVVGCARAWEEAGVRPSVISVCSGSALFGFPLAAGLPAEEVAEFVLTLRSDDFVDLNWTGLASLITGARGFAGIVTGESIERAFRRLLGDMRLGDLPIPCYAPIWNIETNRVEYIGSRTYPRFPVARAARAAIALPLFISPVAIDGLHWCDGGIVDIFPVRPLIELEPTPDVTLAVNGFYPPDFAGEDIAGWEDRTGSILHIASQVRTAQQVELARENLARLREHTTVLMTDPVPYSVVRGVGFYEQFLDRSRWPEFMVLGREHAREALRSWRPAGPGGSARRRAGARPAQTSRRRRGSRTAA